MWITGHSQSFLTRLRTFSRSSKIGAARSTVVIRSLRKRCSNSALLASRQEAVVSPQATASCPVRATIILPLELIFIVRVLRFVRRQYACVRRRLLFRVSNQTVQKLSEICSHLRCVRPRFPSANVAAGQLIRGGVG